MREAQWALDDFMESGARLACPESAGAPDVSAIIPVWNQPHFVLRCLTALLAQRGASLEIVIVDNGSAQPTRRLLERLDDFVILRNAANEGYLKACNRAAAVARGRALLLLNDDAFVREGAVAGALATLESEPGAGAVGGRLVLPSGRLQEAGCAVLPDATTIGLGRNEPIDRAELMRRRDVDYCSGAFLMTPRRLWEALGGFDEAFAPGYYEDSDYCFRLWRAGYRVICEPAAVVDHIERGSERRRGDALATSLRNLRTFRDRHADLIGERARAASRR